MRPSAFFSKPMFSYGPYDDEHYMGVGPLVGVINEHGVCPGASFASHAQRDMETVTYVLHGALDYRDSIGAGLISRPGYVQRLFAGSGLAVRSATRRRPNRFTSCDGGAEIG